MPIGLSRWASARTCRWPRSDSALSFHPCATPAAFRTVSPWRTRTNCSITASPRPSRRNHDGVGNDQRLGRHLSRLLDAEDLQDRRRDILQRTAVTQRTVALLPVDEDERHRVGRVRRVWLAGGFV